MVLLALALDKSPIKRIKAQRLRIATLKEKIKESKYLLISVAVGGGSAIVLPMLADVIGVFGPYLYRVEYLFLATLWLHLTLAYYVRYSTVMAVIRLPKNKLLVFTMVGVIMFVLLCIVIAPMGLLFEMEAYPIPYFIMSFVPSLLFSVSCEIMSWLKSNR